MKYEVIEPEAVEVVSPPTQSLCPNCGTLFPYRSNKTYCSPRCRDAAKKRKARRKAPANAGHSYTKARQQHEKFELAERMAERLYSMPPRDRLGYLESIIRLARDGHSPRVRDILTTPQLIRPNPQNRYLFYRGRVVKGLVPEPPTGEVFEDGTVDGGGPGFKSGTPGKGKSVVTPTIDRAA